MSKRLIRINNKEVYPKLEKYIGAEMNVVLQSGSTHFGSLTSITPEHLIISDTRNHVHHLLLSDIYEVILDTASRLQSLTIK